MAKNPKEAQKFFRTEETRHFFTRWIPETRPVPVRGCEHPGCTSAGDHKAPGRHYREERRSNFLNVVDENLDQSRWFCLDHVKEYNANWDYYEGLETHEIEDAIKFDTVWNRPSWPIGQWGPKRGKNRQGKKATAFNGQRKETPALPPLDEAARMALEELGLTPPVVFTAVKQRYRELVKRHHPDIRGGETNETIQRLNAAFTLLKAFYLQKKSS
jgi:DnaJ-domain-containing protein 1